MIVIELSKPTINNCNNINYSNAKIEIYNFIYYLKVKPNRRRLGNHFILFLLLIFFYQKFIYLKSNKPYKNQLYFI